jgi:hypothetical protein
MFSPKFVMCLGVSAMLVKLYMFSSEFVKFVMCLGVTAMLVKLYMFSSEFVMCLGVSARRDRDH